MDQFIIIDNQRFGEKEIKKLLDEINDFLDTGPSLNNEANNETFQKNCKIVVYLKKKRDRNELDFLDKETKELLRYTYDYCALQQKDFNHNLSSIPPPRSFNQYMIRPPPIETLPQTKKRQTQINKRSMFQRFKNFVSRKKSAKKINQVSQKPVIKKKLRTQVKEFFVGNPGTQKKNLFGRIKSTFKKLGNKIRGRKHQQKIE